MPPRNELFLGSGTIRAKGLSRFNICTVSPFATQRETRANLFRRSRTVALFIVTRLYHQQNYPVQRLPCATLISPHLRSPPISCSNPILESPVYQWLRTVQDPPSL